MMEKPRTQDGVHASQGNTVDQGLCRLVDAKGTRSAAETRRSREGVFGHRRGDRGNHSDLAVLYLDGAHRLGRVDAPFIKGDGTIEGVGLQ